MITSKLWEFEVDEAFRNQVVRGLNPPRNLSDRVTRKAAYARSTEKESAVLKVCTRCLAFHPALEAGKLFFKLVVTHAAPPKLDGVTVESKSAKLDE